MDKIALSFLLIFGILGVYSAYGDPQWTEPKILNSEQHELSSYASSVYYDPVSRINHVLYADNVAHYYLHMALDDEGNVLYQTKFNCEDGGQIGILRGPKDGKHIYLALSTYEHPESTISFTESFDNGQTWSKLIKVGHSPSSVWLQDMIYVKETGRIFIFFYVYGSNEIRLTTRPPNSHLFGNDIIVTYHYGHKTAFLSKVAYNIKDGQIILHMFFMGMLSQLVYVRSNTNGLIWTAPKVIASDIAMVISNAVADSSITNKIACAYITNAAEPARMVVSSDFGETFTAPIRLTSDTIYAEDIANGLKIYGTKEKPMLASFFATSSGALDFKIWDFGTHVQGHYSKHPFDETNISTAGLDIILDEKQQVNLSAFVTKRYEKKTELKFSHGVDSLNK